MSTKLFQHSRMTRIAAVLFLLAGAVGLPTVMLLPDAGFRTVLRAQLAAGGVGERQAQNTWLALYGLVSVLCVAVPLIVTACGGILPVGWDGCPLWPNGPRRP